MKLRDLVKKNDPNAITAKDFGGVWGCPDEYSFIENNKQYTDHTCENCTECWNQEYKEDE
ncbi:MAG: hypothetical protein MR966_11685 [Lachnospiraceae bacterium]|nr:hypothetical protein [Lachnospiraceae bacterium]